MISVRENNCQQKVLYLTKLSFKPYIHINTFKSKKKKKGGFNQKNSLKDHLKEITLLQKEGNISSKEGRDFQIENIGFVPIKQQKTKRNMAKSSQKYLAIYGFSDNYLKSLAMEHTWHTAPI